MKTVDFDELHTFWINFWNYLSLFRYILNAGEVRKAMIGKPSDGLHTRHPFWTKLQEALRTLIVFPKEKSSSNFRLGSKNHTPPFPTGDFLERTMIDVPPELAKQLARQQPPVDGQILYTRQTYEIEDFYLLRDLAVRIPGSVPENPFEEQEGGRKREIWRLNHIELLLRDIEWMQERALAGELGTEHVFYIRGQKGPMMVSVYHKLGRWRMKEIKNGDTLRGPIVHFFS